MAKIDLPARLARRALRRAAAQRRFPKVRMTGMPVLFGNSFPKSGTHLLTQVLAAFGQLGPVVESGLPPVLTFEGESGQPRGRAQIARELRRYLPGDIGYGHVHAYPEAVDALCREGVAPFFIYRDPRDVVVSHVFYVSDINNRHVHHEFYSKQLAGFDARLEVSIRGRPELDIPFPDIRARFEPYLGWLEREEVLALRFETLVNKEVETFDGIVKHAMERGFAYEGSRRKAAETLRSAIAPQRSPTFREGKSGGWREHFGLRHKELFKELSGDLLIRLGYEKDQNW